MENGLFRKKSLERISSPEQLHDYMHVTSPRLWMLLIAVAVLLIGFLAYASTATMENTMPIKVNVQNLPSYGDKEGGDESTMVGLYYSSLPTSRCGNRDEGPDRKRRGKDRNDRHGAPRGRGPGA